MGEKRIILEMGTSNDLYGGDYTKAAIRAVEDAFRHSSLTLFKELAIDHSEMRVQVTVGVAEPAAVDVDQVAASLPRGRAEVRVVEGGLNVDDPGSGGVHVIATAAVEAFIPDPSGTWRLAT